MIEQQDLDFLRAFWTRRAVIAYSLFAFNILIFILMTFAGGTTNEATLLAWGVKSNPEINNGEIWRFVTPIFIHIGLLHLAFNSYVLWIVGPQVEKLYGGPRFLLLYILTGIAGVAASYSYHPDIISAGASGAIFGLFGVLLVFSIRHRSSIPASFRQALGKGMLLTVGINLVIGFMVPHIDNSAHIGGLLAGGALAAVVPFERPGETPHPGLKSLQVALALVIAASFFQVAAHYSGPGLSFDNLVRGVTPGGGSSIGEFVATVNQAQNAFEDSERDLASGDARNLADAEQDLAAAIDRLQRIPSVSSRADELTAELLDLSQKQYEFVQQAQRSGTTGSDFLSGSSPYSRRYYLVKQNLENWVESEGERYGIVNTK